MLFRSTASVRCGVVVMWRQTFQCRKVHVCVCVCVCVVGKEGEEKIEVGAKVTSEGVRPKREEVKEGKLL